MEFVVYVLESIFNKAFGRHADHALCSQKTVLESAEFSPMVAETKVAAVHDLASQYEYPLKASMEET